MDGINRILRYVQWALVPTAVLLAFSQFKVQPTTHAAIAGIVAGVVAMVPEGLVLLTSLAFGVAAMTLARRHVLVQELPAVEGLARRRHPARQDGHPHRGRDQVPRGARDRTRRSGVRGIGRARRRPESQRDDERAVRGVPRPNRLVANRRDAILVRTQVEWRHVRRARHVGAGRARDGVDRTRRGRFRARRRRPARGRRAARLVARAHRRRARRRGPSRWAARVGAPRVRGADPGRRRRHPSILRGARRPLHDHLG